MGAEYATTHQYEPLRTPADWTGDERRLIVQLTEIFDDLYRRFNRLRFEDLGTAVRNRIEDSEYNLSEVRQTATALTAQVSSLDGGVSQLQLTTAGLSAAVAGNRLAFTANGLEIRNAAGVTVFQQDAGVGNLMITGNIAATSGTIGGFTIEANSLHNGTSIMLGADGFVRLGGLTITDNPELGPVLQADGALTLRVGEANYLLLTDAGIAALYPLTAAFGLYVDPNDITSNPPNAYIDPATGKVCRSTSTASSGSLAGTIALSKTSLVAGASLTITAAASGGTEPYTYAIAVSIDDGEYTAISGSSALRTYTPAQAGNYRFRLTVSDAAGNQDISYSGTVAVTAATDPLSITVSANKSTLTGSGSVTWTATATGGSGSYSYAFTIYKGSEIYKTGTSRTLTLTLTEAGVYTATAQVTDTALATVKQVSGGKVTVIAFVNYAITTEASVVMRSGPGTSYGTVVTISNRGTYLIITGDAVSSYYPVQWNSYIGYIPTNRLTIVT